MENTEYEPTIHTVSLDCRTEEMVKILSDYEEPHPKNYAELCAEFERQRVMGRIDEFSDWDNSF